ncbi:MAG: hypothetical protein J6S67_17920 [Methanobrevibacter sp.]|nr:hypothetical protein [Methanobrevibacter sp.]
MDQITGSLNAVGNITGTLNGAGGGGGGATSLSQLNDVNISNPSNNQGLLYNSETGKWVNASLPSGVDELSELTDVDLASLVEGQILQYSDGKWVNRDVSDVWTVSDHVLQMTMTQQGATGSLLVDDLADVLIDLHCSIPLMCPNSIESEWLEQTEKWQLTIAFPYYENVSTFYCLISLRKRGV